MRFYPKQHPLYCGIDLHARRMYVCIVSHNGEVLVHRNMKAAPEPFLKAITPYCDHLVVAGRGYLSLVLAGCSLCPRRHALHLGPGPLHASDSWRQGQT